MNSQCPPCSCLGEAAQSHPRTALAPEQNSPADPCPCQDLCPSCPCDPPQVSLGVPCPSLPADCGPCADPAQTQSSGGEPFTLETPGMCVMRFPLQKSILTVELCPPDSAGTQEELGATKTAGTCLDTLEQLGQELPPVEPCTLEVVELGTDEPCQARGTILGDPCAPQSGISMDPCSSQIGISTDPCSSQSGISTDLCSSPSQGLGDAGDAKDSKCQASPRSPFRLNSCTSSIVERCLSRCQSWFRGKK